MACIDTYKGYTFGHTKTENAMFTPEFLASLAATRKENEAKEQAYAAKFFAAEAALVAGLSFYFSREYPTMGEPNTVNGTVIIIKVTAKTVVVSVARKSVIYGVAVEYEQKQTIKKDDFLHEYIEELAAPAPTAADVAVVAPLAAALEALATTGTLAPAIDPAAVFPEATAQALPAQARKFLKRALNRIESDRRHNSIPAWRDAAFAASKDVTQVINNEGCPAERPTGGALYRLVWGTGSAALIT